MAPARELVLAALVLTCACRSSSRPGDGGVAADASGPPLVRSTAFGEATGEVTNPDRGFYWWDWNEDASLVLVKPQLGDWCGTATLPASVTTALRARLAGHRTAGRRVILRFVYADAEVLNACGLADAASLDIVLGHVAQLTEVLREHTDVIAVVEAGFFGMWGEWNGEHAPPGTSLYTSASNRAALVQALVAAVGNQRTVVVRRPRFRDELSPMLVDLDRVGFHNDCFLASDTDSGTYDGPMSPGEWKAYIRAATTRVPMGGETCADVPAYTACTNAKVELEQLGFSYLHEGYNQDVIDRWRTEGCLDEIRRRLGYRIVLRAVEAPETIARGDTLVLRLSLDNVGYAPPYSTRRPEIVLRSGSMVHVIEPTTTAFDTRTWTPGAMHEAELRAVLPSDIIEGTWEVRLRLLEDVSDAPAYAMIFANDARTLDDARRENVLATIAVTAE